MQIESWGCLYSCFPCICRAVLLGRTINSWFCLHLLMIKPIIVLPVALTLTKELCNLELLLL